MTATGMMVSLDEYLSTVYDPDCEFVDGELIERNRGESDHSAIQTMISALLYSQRREFGIHVFAELRVQVATTRYRVPDITVTKHKVRGKILHEPPFLCIEVLSPEDRASRMEAKIDDYLAFGVKHVWVIDPRRKKASSYTGEGKRESSLVLTTSEPRLTLALGSVFSAVDDDIED
jgi:Uma2 family endonuclease